MDDEYYAGPDRALGDLNGLICGEDEFGEGGLSSGEIFFSDFTQDALLEYGHVGPWYLRSEVCGGIDGKGIRDEGVGTCYGVLNERRDWQRLSEAEKKRLDEIWNVEDTDEFVKPYNL